ncbi:MAG TPA: hypothetical protein VGH91_04560 [Gammaproteobacteria bacterium]|jgi:hypothetical protein
MNGRTEAFAGFKPGQHYLLTLTPVEDPTQKQDEPADGGTLQ